MIPFDWMYCRPQSVEEALEAYVKLESEGKYPVYYAGGSEIITMSRVGAIRPDAVIDIKDIGLCKEIVVDSCGVKIGAACTLEKITQSKAFPLLGTACGRIADHTNQCRITLGGNVCGSIIYRETSLALLVSNADMTICGRDGRRKAKFMDIFGGGKGLERGDLLVAFGVDRQFVEADYFHIKRTANEKIDYPLVSVAGVLVEGSLRIAFSGLYHYPFRSELVEEALNERAISPAKRVENALELLPEGVCCDVRGTDKYRLFVLKNVLLNVLEGVEDGQL